MKTYEEVANKVGLLGLKRTRFLRYMRMRWYDEELSLCLYGYAEEWALRFQSGMEWCMSDKEGQEVLVQLEHIITR